MTCTAVLCRLGAKGQSRIILWAVVALLACKSLLVLHWLPITQMGLL